MHSGQVIVYKVNVLPFVRMQWVTIITDVKEPEFFIDEQQAGPYALWRHKHHFQGYDGGVVMTDEVAYALPLGILGRFAHWLFVAREVNRIFDYRNKVLETYFKMKE